MFNKNKQKMEKVEKFEKKKKDVDNDEDNDDEDDDYMSDIFVDEKLNSNTSLLYSHRSKVEHERYKQRLQSAPKSKRTIAEMEMEQREKALAKPIDDDNKGFLLLQKMMNKSSAAAASSDQNKSFSKTTKKVSTIDENTKHQSMPTTTSTINDLIAERQPIAVEIKTDRLGLGHGDSKRKRLKLSHTKDDNDNNDGVGGSSSSKEEIDRRFREHENRFRENQRLQQAAQYAKKDYYISQRACYNLEVSLMDKPLVDWYWPAILTTITTNAKVDDNDDDEDDVKNDKKEENLEDEEEEEEIDYLARLVQLTTYLNEHYHYCIWCGVRYESNLDLEQNCPGDYRAAHD